MPLGLLLALAVAPEGAVAASDDEAVVITGERVRRTSRETASSHEVFTTREIDRSGAASVDNFLDSIPNVQGGTKSTAPAIRGLDGTGPLRDLPAFTAGVSPRTALLLDGREAGYFEMVFGAAGLWDVRQIEVFRGPQMVTQGRNAIGGAIFVTTRDPEFEWSAGGRLAAGNYAMRDVAGVLNGALSDDVALRLTGQWRRAETFTRIGENMPGVSSNVDKNWMGRAKLLVAPASLPWLRLRLSYQHSQSQAPQTQTVAIPYGRRRNPGATFGVFRIGVDAVTAQADMDLPGDWTAALTATASRSRIRRFAPLRLGVARVTLHDRSVEARTERKTDTGHLAFGLYVQDGTADQWIDVRAQSGIATFDQRRTSIGVFGDVERRFGKVSLGGALRLQYDRQRRSGGFQEPASEARLDFDIRTTSLLPRVTLAYDIDPDWRAGVLVQKAIAPGGGYIPLMLDSDGRFDKERLTDAELFLRGAFGGGRGSFNANLFHYWIRNQQRSVVRPFAIPGAPNFQLAEVLNLSRVWSRGLEANARWRFDDHWSVNASLGLLDSKVVDSGGQRNIADGNDLARTPAISGNAGVEWTAGGWLAAVRFGGRTRYFSDDANTATRINYGHWTLDGRIEKTIGPARLFAYGRNLLNKFGTRFYDNFPEPTDPREVGIGIEARF